MMQLKTPAAPAGKMEMMVKPLMTCCTNSYFMETKGRSQLLWGRSGRS